MDYHTSQLTRLLHNLIRTGTIAEIDNSKQRLRIQSGDLLTGWIDWPAEIGGNYRRWRPLRIGQQVTIACPSGDPNNAVIIAMSYDDNNQPPNTAADADVILFDDGSRIEHRDGVINIHSSGSLNISADGGITINGSTVAITSASLTHNGTNIGDTHTHGGVMSGPASTGAPQ